MHHENNTQRRKVNSDYYLRVCSPFLSFPTALLFLSRQQSGLFLVRSLYTLTTTSLRTDSNGDTLHLMWVIVLI